MKIQRLLTELRQVQVIASGRGVRCLPRLRKTYGGGKWRKMKGIARVELVTGDVIEAELHWYEAHDIGKVMMKVKKPLYEQGD